MLNKLIPRYLFCFILGYQETQDDLKDLPESQYVNRLFAVTADHTVLDWHSALHATFSQLATTLNSQKLNQ